MPGFGGNTGSAYIKQTRRNGVDLPIVGIAVRVTVDRKDLRCKDMLCGAAPASEILAHFGEEELRCEDIRIAIGAAAPRPIRARKAEAALKGQIISDETVAAAATDRGFRIRAERRHKGRGVVPQGDGGGPRAQGRNEIPRSGLAPGRDGLS